MNFTIEQADLMAAITRSSRAVAAKTALPVLANLHLDVRDDHLAISATNLHIGIRSTVPCIVNEPGAITVDTKLMADFVNGLDKAAAVTVATEGKLARSLAVSAGHAKGKISTLLADDFPILPEPDESNPSITMTAAELARLIRATERSAANDDSRPALAGINFQQTDMGTRVAAADGFSLAVFETANVRWLDESVLIPAANARHIAAIAAEVGGDVRMLLNTNGGMVLFCFESVMAWSNIISVPFPDTTQIVPRVMTYRVEVEAGALTSAIKRAQTFARDNNDVVRLTFQAGEAEFDLTTLTVAGTAKERGNGETDLQVMATGPEEGAASVPPLALNAKYAMNAIQSLGSERICIGINGTHQAITFRPVGDENHVYVVMPMTLPRD